MNHWDESIARSILSTAYNYYFDPEQFRFATFAELMYVFGGLIMGTLTGFCIPVSTIQYGEFTTLLVDRNMENQTSNPTLIMKWFGGGMVL